MLSAAILDGFRELPDSSRHCVGLLWPSFKDFLQVVELR